MSNKRAQARDRDKGTNEEKLKGKNRELQKQNKQLQQRIRQLENQLELSDKKEEIKEESGQKRKGPGMCPDCGKGDLKATTIPTPGEYTIIINECSLCDYSHRFKTKNEEKP